MARGFMSGIVSGLVVGVAGLATVSVLTGPVVEPPVEAPVVAPASDMAPEPMVEPVAEPMVEPVAEPVVEPVAEPEVAAEAASMPDPEPIPDPAPMPQDTPEPVAEVPPAPSTTVIVADEDLPRTLPVPDEGESAPVAAPATPPAPTTPPAPVAQAPASETAPDRTAATATPMVEPMEDALPHPAPTDGEGAERPAPSDDVLAAVVPGPATPPVPAETAPEVSDAPAAVPADPIIGPQAETPPQGDEQTDAPPAPIKSAPVTQIGDLAPNVTTNRLPTIGGGEGEQGGEAAHLAAAEIVPSSLAIERNAAEFENPEGRPLMAVALLDVPTARNALGDLKNLPFAVSFVVDAGAADAAEAITFYRAAGAEVIVAVPLPEGATPADVEVTLQAQAPHLSTAVAVMMAADFQAAGPSARQVAVVLAEQGLGLVSVPQGLNTGHKSAVKAGVPAGLVFRDLDNDGQSAAVIRRFMDNAAFKARQEKGVIMLGHARLETVQALIEWTLGNRAKSVALAPLSAVLLDR